jgi:hypothetical protein
MQTAITYPFEKSDAKWSFGSSESPASTKRFAVVLQSDKTISQVIECNSLWAVVIVMTISKCNGLMQTQNQRGNTLWWHLRHVLSQFFSSQDDSSISVPLWWQRLSMRRLLPIREIFFEQQQREIIFMSLSTNHACLPAGIVPISV